MRNEELGEQKELKSRILHCDSHCVVVNKIAGEAVEGAREGMVDLPRELAAVLAAQPLAEDVLPVAAHRIDVPVSGCVVFARTEEALRFLNTAFKNNAVEKRYWAIIEQPQNNIVLPENENIELIHFVQFDPRQNKSIAHNEPGPGRKKAILRYRLAGRGRDYLFLEIDLITGRHHQIRAQLKQTGLHIKGDLKYGARRSEKTGGIRLHAHSLSFPNPAPNGETYITVQADPPQRDNLWLAFEEFTNARYQ
ncbi:MAG: RNA pseudouridine synthase [Treponema sp.]|nr:RNA pseudouridine synthase [Treponema sp.]